MNANPDSTPAPASEVVADLVDSGLIAPEDRSRAIGIVSARLSSAATAGPTGPASTLVATLLGYVGGILVLAAGAVFLSLRWDQLSLNGRVFALAAGGLLLAAAAVGVRVSDPGRPSARRQLAGVLGLGAAALGAAAVGTYVESDLDRSSSATPALAFGTFTVLTLLFYVMTPSMPGQLGLAFGTVVTTFSLAAWTSVQYSSLVAGMTLVLIGIAWSGLAEAGVWAQEHTARLSGGAIALVGAQSTIVETAIEDRARGLVYVLLALVGFGGFAAYLRIRQWPYLAIGVVGLTLAATEAAVDYIDGSGAAVGLLVAGSVLLLTSLLALRLHRDDVPRPAA